MDAVRSQSTKKISHLTAMGYGFDSHRPLQILRKLRRYVILYIFQLACF